MLMEVVCKANVVTVNCTQFYVTGLQQLNCLKSLYKSQIIVGAVCILFQESKIINQFQILWT